MVNLKKLIIVLIVLTSCKSTNLNCEIGFNEVRQLLGGIINKEQTFDKCFKVELERQEDELNGISWYEKKYYKDQKLIFQSESNWQNDSIVSRIIIYDSLISINKKISVGKEFAEIRKYLSDSIPSVQDGYLLVSPKELQKVVIELDIENVKDSQLYYGVSRLEQIPDSLIVKSIILTQ
jgi:hypothetical protein